MATGQSIALRALRILRVIDAQTPPEAQDAADAIETLSAMLAEWHVAGIGVPNYDVADYTNESVVDDADREAVAYQLAVRLAPEYGKALSAEAAAIADASMARLRLRYFQPGSVDLSEMPGTCGQFDINTGDFA